MDEDLYTEDTGRAHSTGNSWGSEPCVGAFFPRSHNFVVEGGVFTNNVTNVTHNHHTYPPSPDFRRIPMGEIDLQHEIRFDDGSGVVYRRRRQRCAQRMYSAKIDGCKTAMTVALYQGPNAEQAWQEDISMHSWLRHPNFVQLYGVASTGHMYAAVFHDDRIPLEQFRDIHCNSPILSLYFRAYWSHEFWAVNFHLSSMFNRTVDEDNCTLWIRASTRRLCVDDMILNDNNVGRSYSYLYPNHWKPGREDIERMAYSGPNHEAMVISSLALSDYHKFCGSYLSHPTFFFPAHATATVGMVVRHHSNCEVHHPNCEVELPVNVAFLPLLDGRDTYWTWDWDWSDPRKPDGASSGPWILDGDLMPNSWRRYNLHQIFAVTAIHRYISFDCTELWLSQANHIFSSLQIRSNHNQYVIVRQVTFTWAFSPTTRSSCPSQGWLFLCPDAQLRSGPCSFRWPDCAAYWARDPFGVVRLSPEEAEEAGFPLITLELSVFGHSWDSIDYAQLWQFHQAKGFAPDSQEIARHLGHPLYQLCDEVAVETPFAHVTDGGIEEDNTDQHDATNMATMSDEHVYETVDSEDGHEDEKFEGLQADILLPSRGVRFLSKLPAVILALVVLCCLSYTTY